MTCQCRPDTWEPNARSPVEVGGLSWHRTTPGLRGAGMTRRPNNHPISKQVQLQTCPTTTTHSGLLSKRHWQPSVVRRRIRRRRSSSNSTRLQVHLRRPQIELLDRYETGLLSDPTLDVDRGGGARLLFLLCRQCLAVPRHGYRRQSRRFRSEHRHVAIAHLLRTVADVQRYVGRRHSTAREIRGRILSARCQRLTAAGAADMKQFQRRVCHRAKKTKTLGLKTRRVWAIDPKSKLHACRQPVLCR